MRVSSFPPSHPISTSIANPSHFSPLQCGSSPGGVVVSVLRSCSCFSSELRHAVSLELERKEARKERARVSTNQTEPDRCRREDSEVGGVLVYVGVLCGRF